MFAEAQLKARKFLDGNISQLRAIQQSEKFTVTRTVEIVPGYVWAEIKNSVRSTK